MTALFTAVEFRAHEGFSDDPPTDAQIDELILEWQDFLERATGQFYDPRILEFFLDGSGSNLLQLPLPIIDLEWIRINESTTNLSADEFVVYNGRQMPNDDRTNPRIKLKSFAPSIFSDPEFRHTPFKRPRNFLPGSQNQQIRGTWGYVEADGITAPPLILKALRRLVMRDAEAIADGGSPSGGGSGPSPAGTVLEEWTDGHKIKYGDPGVAPVTATSTGDSEVDRIIKMFKRPLAIGGARAWSDQI